MAEILIVDDERVMRDGLKMTLQGEGYDVRTARDGEDALKKIAEKRPDLVLLDVMMPKMNGFRCCEELRKTDEVIPVIFLTAKESECDQVRGIGLGADDYIAKSASDAILLARINRILTRTQRMSERSTVKVTDLIRLGSLTINLKLMTVSLNGNLTERLTRTEADILKILSANRGKAVAFEDIIAYLRGKGFSCEDTMLYMHVSNLRRKLGAGGSKIVTRHGVGYSLG